MNKLFGENKKQNEIKWTKSLTKTSTPSDKMQRTITTELQMKVKAVACFFSSNYGIYDHNDK